MHPFVLVAPNDVPPLAVRRGDRVVFQPGATWLFTRCSPADPGAVLNAWELGQLVPDGSTPPPPCLIRAAVGAASRATPPAARPSQRSRWRVSRLLRHQTRLSIVR